MRVKLIRPCPKFAYPGGHEFDLEDKQAGKWIELGYMVAMGAKPMELPEKPVPKEFVKKRKNDRKL